MILGKSFLWMRKIVQQTFRLSNELYVSSKKSFVSYYYLAFWSPTITESRDRNTPANETEWRKQRFYSESHSKVRSSVNNKKLLENSDHLDWHVNR